MCKTTQRGLSLIGSSLRIPCQSDTVENRDYLIPTGLYELRLHRWSKSGKLVPELMHVPGHSAILIHNGYPNPDCSKGCILTNQAMVDWLVRLIQTPQTLQTNEKVYLRITNSPALAERLFGPEALEPLADPNDSPA